MGDRPVFSYLISISGRVPSGSPGSSYWTMINRAFGNRTVTTTMGIPGSKSDTKVIELASPVPPPGKWQNATVTDIRPETATAKTFRLALAAAAEYLAGQHYLIR